MYLSRLLAVVGGRAGEPPPAARDRTLDVLKGVAIVTVVLGHALQGVTPDFAHYPPFLILYSFHMPMFMFVAGMAMSAGIFAAVKAESPRVVDYVFRRALRLLVPFVAWAVIQFAWARPADSIVSWLSIVFHTPDNGLWFLLALFEISVVVALCAWFARLALRRLDATARATRTLVVLAACLALGSGIFWLLRYVFPSLGPATHYIKYVCLGILYRRLFPSGLHPALGFAAFLLFATLSPFWVWLGPPAIDWHPPMIDERIVTAVFDLIVGVSGTLALVEAVRLLAPCVPSVALQGMAFCGRRTLDIYALHYYFFAVAPPVVGPIVASLLASLVLRQVPLAPLILFGDAKYRPLWLRAFDTWRGERALASRPDRL
jgi:fucose 4-O-acetylase-like acetyltransferase